MSLSNFGGASPTANPKTALMQQVQQEAAIANARALVTVRTFSTSPSPCHTNIRFQSINQNCYEKCVPKPGTSLAKGEEQCFTMCMEKYMAAWNAVSRSYVARLQQESQARGGLGGVNL